MDPVAAYEGHFTRPAARIREDLESYANLLRKWQKVQNLVSRETLDDLWTRHFADSLQVLKYVKETDNNFVDFGSGGGLPAIPLAIALQADGRRFVLVEPTARKASFLRTVSRELDLGLIVINKRAEDTDSRETGAPNVITSRALASLTLLCERISPFFASETRALLHKGREHVDELAEAGGRWQFDVVVNKSDTDPGAAILTLSNLRRKSAL